MRQTIQVVRRAFESAGSGSAVAKMLNVSRATAYRWKLHYGLRLKRHPNLAGMRIGRLVVVDVIEGPGLRSSVKCQCDCGKIHYSNVNTFKAGECKSCGCWKRDCTILKNLKHGGCGTPEYKTWQAMLQRCCDPGMWNYKYYGGRGIHVCKRWRRNFAAFLMDMGKKPKGYTIDRINPFKGYSPTNCRWATWSEQRKNTRKHYALRKKNGR